MTVRDIFEHLSSEWKLSGDVLSRGEHSYYLKNGSIHQVVDGYESFYSFNLETRTMDTPLFHNHYTASYYAIHDPYDPYTIQKLIQIDLYNLAVILEDVKQIIEAYKQQCHLECSNYLYLVEHTNYEKRGRYASSIFCKVYNEVIMDGKRCKKCLGLLKK